MCSTGQALKRENTMFCVLLVIICYDDKSPVPETSDSPSFTIPARRAIERRFPGPATSR